MRRAATATAVAIAVALAPACHLVFDLDDLEPTSSDLRWRTVAAGRAHVCAIRADDDSLWCWGANESRQLGDGTTEDRLTPVRSAEGAWLAVAPGHGHTCAIRADHTLWCWGLDDDGQLGLGAGPHTGPFQVGSSAWRTVVASRHTCGIQMNGTAWCWGHGAQGQLGTGEATNHEEPAPVVVDEPDLGWTSIDAGALHTCGTRADSSLWCWGDNELGQAGNSDLNPELVPRRITAVEVPELDLGWDAVAVGQASSCARRHDGTAYCWGDNRVGQLGDGSGVLQFMPRRVDGPRFASIESGALHACGLTDDRELWCWGGNGRGALGLDDRAGTPRLTPAWTELRADVVAAGDDVTCRIDASGLTCTGANGYGQLGDGAGGIRPTPFLHEPQPWQLVSAGDAHTCASAADRRACWGSNASRQLTGVLGAHRAAPATVPVAGNIVAGGRSSCHFSEGQKLLCWGDNGASQLGLGAEHVFVPAFGVPMELAGTWLAIAMGHTHACGIAADNTLWCWGQNAHGQLGTGDLVASPSPKQVLVLGPVVAVAVGRDHSCAIDTQALLWCWGNNERRQLGPNTAATALNQPLEVMTGVKVVSAGLEHTCAVDSAGNGSCWGGNRFGQLGLAPGTDRPEPHPLGGGWQRLVAGVAHTCGLTFDGEVLCWGRNRSGQLGDGTTTPRFTPAIVPGGPWTMVTVGEAHTCALGETRLACWGDNGLGQVGDGTAWRHAFAPITPPL